MIGVYFNSLIFCNRNKVGSEWAGKDSSFHQPELLLFTLQYFVNSFLRNYVIGIRTAMFKRMLLIYHSLQRICDAVHWLSRENVVKIRYFPPKCSRNISRGKRFIFYFRFGHLKYLPLQNWNFSRNLENIVWLQIQTTYFLTSDSMTILYYFQFDYLKVSHL